MILLLPQAQRTTIEALPELPFERTPDVVVETMLTLADVGPSTVLIDLGSGDGRIVHAAARRGARAIGVEVADELLQLARANTEASVGHLVEFVKGDLRTFNLSQATVVTVYWLPALCEEFGPRLFKELPPGSIIMSHDYVMPSPFRSALEFLISDLPEKVPINGADTAYVVKYVTANVTVKQEATLEDLAAGFGLSMGGASTFVIPYRFLRVLRYEVRYTHDYTTMDGAFHGPLSLIVKDNVLVSVWLQGAAAKIPAGMEFFLAVEIWEEPHVLRAQAAPLMHNAFEFHSTTVNGALPQGAPVAYENFAIGSVTTPLRCMVTCSLIPLPSAGSGNGVEVPHASETLILCRCVV
jgi:hypothetical protein